MLKLFVVAIFVALLLHFGICPLTIQLIVVAAILWRARRPAAVQEHFGYNPPSDRNYVGFHPPKQDHLSNCVETMDGNLKDVQEIADMSQDGTTYKCSQKNLKPDVLALITDAPWSGGKSRDCDVFGDFTIAVTMQLHVADSEVTVLEVVGFDSNQDKSSLTVKVRPTTASRRSIDVAYGKVSVPTGVTASTEPLTIIVRRDGVKLTVTQYVHSVNDTATGEGGTREMADPKLTAGGNDFPVVFGHLHRGQAELTRLMVYNVALTDDEISVLVKQGLKTQVFKQALYQEIVDQLDEANSRAVLATTGNPYKDDGVQAACAAVKNWTMPNAIAYAGQSCWDSINNFCSKNPGHPGCECWGAEKDSLKCKKFLATMSSSDITDLDNLKDEDVAAIMQKYKLAKVVEKPAAPAPGTGTHDTGTQAPAPAPARRRRRWTSPTRDRLYEDEEELIAAGTHGWHGRREGARAKKRGFWRFLLGEWW